MSPPVRGQFLAGPSGPLAMCVWRPPPDLPCRFATLFVPAAFDELNKARRMAAMQARAFAALGGLVAVVDPRGTGDSGGDHADATWAGWQEDVQCAWHWLEQQTAAPRVLHGLRLGALLAAQLTATRVISPSLLVLWQPVLAGGAFFNQFLRLSTAQQVLGRGEGGGDAKALRRALAAGQHVEVAGYDLHPDLVSGAEAVELGKLPAPECPVVWRETAGGTTPTLSPAARNAAAAWTQSGAQLDIDVVSGPSFWTTQEIAEAPELIAATSNAVAQRFALEGNATA